MHRKYRSSYQNVCYDIKIINLILLLTKFFPWNKALTERSLTCVGGNFSMFVEELILLSFLPRGLNQTFSGLQVENIFPRVRIVVQLVRAVCLALLVWIESVARKEIGITQPFTYLVRLEVSRK